MGTDTKPHRQTDRQTLYKERKTTLGHSALKGMSLSNPSPEGLGSPVERTERVLEREGMEDTRDTRPFKSTGAMHT